jgi:hypothetical protein
MQTLDRGAVLRVSSGPADADGYAWYELVDLDNVQGWVAAGRDAEPWLQAVPVQAPMKDVLLRFERGCEITPRSYASTDLPADVTVTADGRVVYWLGGGTLGENDGKIAVRQLSPSGLAQFQRDVLSLPALRQSAEYRLQRLPGTPEPPGHGVCSNSFVIGAGSNAVVVNATNWQGDEEEASYWVASPERKTLDELAHGLTEVEAWLGESAWSDPVARPYVSDSYMLWLEPRIDIPSDGTGAVSVSGVPWPFDGPIEMYGESVNGGRCGYLRAGQAFETLRFLRELGVIVHPLGLDQARPAGLDTLGFGDLATDSEWYSFWIMPRSPDGYPDCPT